MDLSAQNRLDPNPDCVLYCPVIDIDRLAAMDGNPITERDYQRHLAQSNECTGTVNNDAWTTRRCPLFNVQADLINL